MRSHIHNPSVHILLVLASLFCAPYSLAHETPAVDWNISYKIGKFELRTDCEGWVDDSPCLLIFGTPGSIVGRELTDWNNYAVSLSTPIHQPDSCADGSPRSADGRPLEELIQKQPLFSFFEDRKTTAGVAVFGWGTSGLGGATYYLFDTDSGRALSVHTPCRADFQLKKSYQDERYLLNAYETKFFITCTGCGLSVELPAILPITEGADLKKITLQEIDRLHDLALIKENFESTMNILNDISEDCISEGSHPRLGGCQHNYVDNVDDLMADYIVATHVAILEGRTPIMPSSKNKKFFTFVENELLPEAYAYATLGHWSVRQEAFSSSSVTNEKSERVTELNPNSVLSLASDELRSLISDNPYATEQAWYVCAHEGVDGVADELIATAKIDCSRH